MNALYPLLAFTLTGAALHISRGHYNDGAIILTFASWVFIFISLVRPGLPFKRFKLEHLMALALVFFLYKLLRNPMVAYPEIKAYSRAVKGCLWVGLFLGLFVALKSFSTSKRGLVPAAWALMTTLLGARAFTLLASPNPIIDVFTIGQAGADHLLRGENPYRFDYPDLYKGFYDYKPGYTYWPAVLYVEAIFKVIFGDIRVSLIAAELAIAGLAYRIASFSGWNRNEAVFLPMLFLAFPSSLFVLEHAWVDTFLLLYGTIVIWFAMKRNWMAAGIALGLFCSVKQYAIFFAFLTGALSLKDERPKAATLRLVGASLVTFIAVTLPLALWDWPQFYERTIHMPLAIGMRPDALTLVAWARKMGYFEITGSVSGPIYVAMTLFAAIAILRKSGSAALTAFTTAVPMLYGIVFLLGKQAFCNYYQLFAGFVLIQLASFRSTSNPAESLTIDSSHSDPVVDRLR